MNRRQGAASLGLLLTLLIPGAAVSLVTPISDLTILKSHSGNFTQGEVGQQYTITVSNVGSAATSGTVTVTDSLPAGLTATGFGGTGWSSCTATPVVGPGSLSCQRGDALAASGSYPAITLTVSVASNAPSSVTNTATVAGGGEVNTTNDSVSDPTTIDPAPDLVITKSHTPDPLVVGQTGTYTLTVGNVGNIATISAVSVTDVLPAGLTATSFTGTGWSCSPTPFTGSGSCSRSDALAAGSSYPGITLTVSVGCGFGGTVSNTASVAGGGETNTTNDTATDPASISGPDLTIQKSHSGNFTQGDVGQQYTLTVSNRGSAPTSGTVTVTDSLPAGLTATGFGGTGWSSCTAAPVVGPGALSCQRSDALATSSSYPPITLTVSVANNAPASVTNSASVAGCEIDTTNDTATDPTTINVPDLTIQKSHSGTFSQGDVGKQYTITVGNVGSAPVSGTVTVTDSLPIGLTATGFGGTGWTSCTATPVAGPAPLSCQRSDALAAGSSYPPITLTVSVALDAPATVTNSATVAGGGETATANDNASDPTPIQAAFVALVPTLSRLGLLLLCGGVAALGLWRLRRW